MADVLVTDGRGGRLIALSGDQIDDEFGSTGPGFGQFRQPCGIALNPFDGFLIADRANDRIASFQDFSGSNWQTFGTTGTGTFELRRPSGVAFDENGRIWIADSGNRRVVRIDEIDGTNWATFGTSGRPTPVDPAAGAFWDPIGVAVTPSGQVLIADPGAGRIVRVDDIDGSGWSTTAFGTLRSPTAVVSYGSGYAVADFGAASVVVLDASLTVQHVVTDLRLSGVAGLIVSGGELRALVPPLRAIVRLTDSGTALVVAEVTRLAPAGIREPLALGLAP
jgi:DNA-binding beta-propeller fold protein YncE